MASDSYRISHMRTITFLSAGAALLAVIGYFLMKSDRKKQRRKSNSNEVTPNQDEIDIQYNHEYLIEAESNTNSIEENTNEELFFQNSFEKSVIDEDHLQAIPDDTNELNQLDSGTSSGFSSLHKFDEKKSTDYLNEETLLPSENNFESELGNQIDELYENTTEITNSPSVYSDSSKEEENQVEQTILTEEITHDINIKEDLLVNNGEIDSQVSVENFSAPSNLEEEPQLLETKVPIAYCENTDDNTLSISEANELHSINSTNNTTNENSSFEFIDDRRSIEHEMSTNSKSNASVTSTNSPGKRTKKRNDSKRSRNSTSISSVSSSIGSNTKNSPSKKNKNKLKPINQTFDIEASDPNDTEDLVVYEFNFPRKLCGKLIGKNGVHVDYIRSKTQTQIAVRNDTKISDLQVVCVSGRISDVDKALDIIGIRFPSKLYPQISFKPITKPIVYRRFNKSKSNSPLDSDQSKILVASTNFVEFIEHSKDGSHQPIEVQVTAIVNAGHVFVQLPKNPTYSELQQLDKNMLDAYDSMSELVPNMNEPVDYGTICAAPTSYGWHRAMITSYRPYEEVKEQLPEYNEICGLATVKFLDYGGYLNIPVNQLRQLRSDFMILPFQGIECFLDGCWNANQSLVEEGRMFLSQQIKESLTEALVVGYSEDGMPLIRLFISNNMVQKYCLNDELGKLGLVINFKNNTEELLNSTSIYNQNVQSNIFNKDQNDINDRRVIDY